MKHFWWKSFLCLLALFVLFPAGVFAATFMDTTEKTTIHFAAIEYLSAKGVVSGYDDGSFKPDKTINRAEALKMVMIASGMEESAESGQVINFPDVQEDDWFYDYVKKGVETNLVEGYDDGMFKPANNINIAESLKIVFLAFEEKIGNPPTKNPYPDVDVLDWYAVYAQYGKDKQFIESMDEGKLRAERDITRGEFAQVIYRLLYTEEHNLDKFPLSTDWPEYKNGDKGYSLKYPFGWTLIEAGDQIIFWKKDSINEQLSWARVYPNSATVVVAVDGNEDGLSLKEYLKFLEYDSSAAKLEQQLNNYPFASISLDNVGINDYYFELPVGDVLVAYSQVGAGDNEPLLREQIRYLIGSIRHYEGGDSGTSVDIEKENFLADVRLKVLKEGDGQAVLDMFDDELLIETDSIGIGTGPVDYYYSGVYDVTLKYERDSNTVLAMNDGNSTAF